MKMEQSNDTGERYQLEMALRRIPEISWQAYLASEQGQDIAQCILSSEEALDASGYDAGRHPRKPVSEIVDLLGSRVLADSDFGPWVRRELLLTLRVRKRQWIEQQFEQFVSPRARNSFRILRKPSSRAERMAKRWRSGSRWARVFCEVLGLPDSLAKGKEKRLVTDEEILPAEPLPPLHDFQLEVYGTLRRLLRSGNGNAGMLSLPTGAGKTRVTVEAICDHMAENYRGQRAPTVLWIAQSAELQEQAWECFRQVWQVPPLKTNRDVIPRRKPLKLVRLWGGRKTGEVDIPDQPCVLIASVDQLASWARNGKPIMDLLRGHRFSGVVIDEAHSVLTSEYRSVLVALGIRAQKQWRMLASAPPLIGLSATPWRRDDRESRALLKFFKRRLLKPERLGEHPIRALQDSSILSEVNPKKLQVVGTRPMTPRQRARFDKFNVLPPEYLEILGREKHRNALILSQLLSLSTTRRVLVFACSVEHAKLLVLALNKATGEPCAALVTAKTPRAERYEIIDRFRSGRDLRFLCNVNVLTLGFDAPKTDVVCITRPTWSAVAYEQMVGRGLRGPLNGGTKKCVVMDVQDTGLPGEVQSYSRVLDMWDG